MKELKLYLCEADFDLMTDEECDLAPNYDVYHSYLVVAANPEDALFNNVLRYTTNDNEEVVLCSTEDLVADGLPVSADDYKDFIKDKTNLEDLGQVLWKVTCVGTPDISKYAEGDLVISNFKSA